MMLTREEEHRLAAVLGVSKRDIQENIKAAEEYTVETVYWLANRLKELNTELKQKPRIQEVAVVHRHREGYGLLVEELQNDKGTLAVKICATCHLIVDVQCRHDMVKKLEGKFICGLCGSRVNAD